MSKLKKRIDELEEWVGNINTIQNQLLKKLGYEVKHKMPTNSNVYISKIKKPSDKKDMK